MNGCKQCGKLFYYKKNKKRKFCSKSCNSTFQNNKRYANSSLPLEVCEVCSKNFHVKPSRKFKQKSFCCSRECRGALLKTIYLGNNNPNFKYEHDIERVLTNRISSAKSRAEDKELPFDITKDFLLNLYKKQNGLCYYTGLPMKIYSESFIETQQTDIDSLSIDKIVPKLGYVESNVVLCCSGINKLKGSADLEDLSTFLTYLGLKSFGTCNLKFKKLRENAEAPCRAKLGDGGYDLSAAHIEDLGDQLKVFTGIACQPDFGWVMLALPRSSICKKQLRLSNSVGLIDNQYRGEIVAIFDKKDLNADIKIGDKIIQLLFVRYPFVNIEEVEELTNSERGIGGFGSTDTGTTIIKSFDIPVEVNSFIKLSKESEKYLNKCT